MRISDLLKESKPNLRLYGNDLVAVVGSNTNTATVKILKSNRFKIGRLMTIPLNYLDNLKSKPANTKNTTNITNINQCPKCGADCFVDGVECGCGYKT